eukprot:scaffold105676_cov51-Phaeocystis_antarctica.AAC.4
MGDYFSATTVVVTHHARDAEAGEAGHELEHPQVEEGEELARAWLRLGLGVLLGLGSGLAR